MQLKSFSTIPVLNKISENHPCRAEWAEVRANHGESCFKNLNLSNTCFDAQVHMLIFPISRLDFANITPLLLLGILSATLAP